MHSVRLGLIQFAATDDKASNLERATALVRRAAQAGAPLICLQELFTTVYFPLCPTNNQFFDLAEPVDGPTIQHMSALARELGIFLLAPIYEEANGGRFFNSAVLIGDDGKIIGVTRKNHIPRIHIDHPTWGEIDEKHYFEPGMNGYPVWNTPLGRIGVLICHDRHFPEAARLLALEGADIVLVPSASRGIPDVGDPLDAWLIELRAHAIANMYYVGAVNRVGLEQGERFLGHSVIIGPDGVVLQMAGGEDAVICADLDLDTVRATRIARGFLRDRRPDTYTGLSK
ncbi:MAG TPA: nitrilase-related carbon-nitrogen hydrolase [Anaerolineae bacterium]|nr:nitrilase-related carbon-nitrogen hydrolase [Anaerolineae bacterium]